MAISVHVYYVPLLNTIDLYVYGAVYIRCVIITGTPNGVFTRCDRRGDRSRDRLHVCLHGAIVAAIGRAISLATDRAIGRATDRRDDRTV